MLAHGTFRAFGPFDRSAQERDGVGQPLAQFLDEFEALWRSTLAGWRYAHLTERHLDLRGTHPALGKVTLRNLLATWVVHDLGHVALIARVTAKCSGDDVGPWREYLPALSR